MSEQPTPTPTVAVIGVGAMGSMAMWRLSIAGFAVTGFERYGVPHDRGAHGAETRIFRMAYREGEVYIPLLKESHTMWQQLSAASGRTLFIQNGCLYISDLREPWLEETMEAADRHHIPYLELDDASLASRYPQHRVFGGERAILDLLGGTLRPELAVWSAAEQAIHHGATLRDYTQVVGLVPDDSGVEVVLADGTSQRFDYAVISPGAWASGFADELGFHLTARRLPGTWYPAVKPSDFIPERFPVCMRSAGDIDYSGFPAVDGWSVKVMPPVFPDTETVADAVDREIHPSDIDYTRRVVRDLLNGLVDKPSRTGVFLDGFLETDQPVIDYASGTHRVVGAVGFAGHGFKYSPAVGQLLTDLIARDAGYPTSSLLEEENPFARPTTTNEMNERRP